MPDRTDIAAQHLPIEMYSIPTSSGRKEYVFGREYTPCVHGMDLLWVSCLGRATTSRYGLAFDGADRCVLRFSVVPNFGRPLDKYR